MPLRRFWTEASGHCHCKYWWNTPEVFHPQLKVAFSEWGGSHIWGGAEFESPRNIIKLAESFASWAESIREDSPKDARIWENSFPLIPFGNGDYAGLYVRDDADDPPVVYICHEECGSSGVIASTFDEFLNCWEQMGYIGLHFLCSLINRRTDLIDPDAFPVEVEAIRALLHAEARPDLVKPPREMTEKEWLSSVDPEAMLEWLEHEGKCDERKVRLYCCACCRVVWDRMKEKARHAVEVAERFADGKATFSELQAARTGLTTAARAGVDPLGSLQAEGPMHGAAYSALDAKGWFISWEITSHLDEPELLVIQAAHANLVRHIFGNPFRPAADPAIRQIRIVGIAKRVYDGEPCSGELAVALKEAGHDELAEHFLRPDHPKGCWALDLILGH
jgi:hypothetical protein